MDYVIRILSGVLLLSFGVNCWATCAGRDEKISDLLKDKKYTEAEQIAAAAKMESPNDIEAAFRLAHVYMVRALSSKISIDTQAMGLGDGETGTIQLKEGDVEKYLKSVIDHDPVFGNKAEQALKEIIGRWKSDKRAYWCLMNYYRKSNRHEDLIAFIPEVVAAFKGEGYSMVDDLLPYPAQYAKDGELGQAVAVYVELLKHFPKSAPVHSSYGYVKLKQGDLPGAIELFEKAYALDKRDKIIVGNIANSYLYARDFKKSRMYLHELIALDPEATEPYFTLAILAMSESISGSRKAWDSYFKQNEKHPDDAQWVKLAGQISESVDKSMNDDSIYRLAITLNNGNAPNYAIPLLIYLDGKHPDDVYYLFGLAQAYEYAGIPLEAYDYAVRAAALINKGGTQDTENTASINFEAGRLAYMIEKYNDSLGYFKITEKQAPDFENLQYMLGMVNERLGDTQEAVKQYQNCIKKDSNKFFHGYCKSNYSRLAKTIVE